MACCFGLLVRRSLRPLRSLWPHHPTLWHSTVRGMPTRASSKLRSHHARVARCRPPAHANTTPLRRPLVHARVLATVRHVRLERRLEVRLERLAGAPLVLASLELLVQDRNLLSEQVIVRSNIRLVFESGVVLLPHPRGVVREVRVAVVAEKPRHRCRPR